MKKLLKILFILLIPILISSCGSKDYKEGQLVELSGLELTNNFSNDQSEDFIFAIVNENKKGYKEFLVDLEKYAKETNKAIYFTYYNHIDTEAAFYIFNSFEADFTTNGYHVLEDGALTVTEEYKDYNTLKASLEDKRFYAILNYTSEKDIEKYMKLAQEEYDKGNISVSFDYINKIWNKEEAKTFYNYHKELWLVKPWEHFTITDDKRPRITYRSLLFHNGVNYYLETLTKEYKDVFEKPTNMSKYDLVYYYVKDDIIYTSDIEDGTYTKRFKIVKIENTSVHLFDYKYNKDYIYTRRV